MTNIINFFGCKGSGKDTCGLFIFGSYLCSLGLVDGGFTIKPEGLWVTDIMGDKNLQGRFDPRRNTQVMKDFLAEYVDPYIKLYSFADELKQFCINVLGLSWEQCYGTNDQKNSLTHLRWKNMPGVVTPEEWSILEGRLEPNINSYPEEFKLIYNKSGQMTAREVLQYFGTDIVRKMYSPAWAKATLNKINREQPLLAVITDCRFEDELDEAKNNGSRTIKLLRQPYKDEHISENINIADDKFDAIINNINLTIDEQNDKLIEILNKWELLPQMEILG